MTRFDEAPVPPVGRVRRVRALRPVRIPWRGRRSRRRPLRRRAEVPAAPETAPEAPVLPGPGVETYDAQGHRHADPAVDLDLEA